MKRYTPVRKVSSKQRKRMKNLTQIRMNWFHKERRRCGICQKIIVHFDEYTLDHIIPGKMGGCKDDSESNLQPAHWWCNSAKGSRRSA